MKKTWMLYLHLLSCGVQTIRYLLEQKSACIFKEDMSAHMCMYRSVCKACIVHNKT